jgi:hypothetical protein
MPKVKKVVQSYTITLPDEGTPEYEKILNAFRTNYEETGGNWEDFKEVSNTDDALAEWLITQWHKGIVYDGSDTEPDD